MQLWTPRKDPAHWGKLRRFLHHPITDIVVMLLIMGSVIGIVVEILVGPGPTQHILEIVGDVFIGIFVIELSLRLLAAPNKWRFFRSYWLDILAILPLMRALRILRLLRLLRLFRFGVMLDRRVSRAFRLFWRGIEGYLVVVFAIVTFVLVGALSINIIEGGSNTAFESIQDALWWSVMSLIAGEPVGGQAATQAGRAIELALMIGGVTVFAMFTGTVTAAVLQVVNDRTEEINMEIDDLTGHVLVCGWKRGCEGMIAELQQDAALRAAGIVVVSDQDSEPDLHRAGASPDRVYFLRGDHTRVDVLQRAGVDRATMAIIVPDKLAKLSDQDRDARSVLTALVIEKLNKNAYVVVELLNPDNEAYLRMAGVEEVLVADRHTGRLIGAACRSRGLMSTVRELLTSEYGNQFFKMPVPQSWWNREAGELHGALKQLHDATLIAIERATSDPPVLVNPQANLKLASGDQLVYVARKSVKSL